MSWFDDVRGGWHMATKYGYRKDFILEPLKFHWERFRTCRMAGKHQEKMGTPGRCYRCGKAVRG